MESFMSNVVKEGLYFKALLAIFFTSLDVMLFTTSCYKPHCTAHKKIHKFKYSFLILY